MSKFYAKKSFWITIATMLAIIGGLIGGPPAVGLLLKALPALISTLPIPDDDATPAADDMSDDSADDSADDTAENPGTPVPGSSASPSVPDFQESRSGAMGQQPTANNQQPSPADWSPGSVRNVILARNVNRVFAKEGR